MDFDKELLNNLSNEQLKEIIVKQWDLIEQLEEQLEIESDFEPNDSSAHYPSYEFKEPKSDCKHEDIRCQIVGDTKFNYCYDCNDILEDSE